ncbi:MAG TPA: V4R domain-containing protein [Anaerolineales bacterium]|nr:V4R domain-containing protein [Anaerolineales bacterium]
MDPIPKSGYHYPNKAGRIFLEALEEVMGKNGVSAILNLASLESWIDNYPPDNLGRQLDFADFSAVNGALEEMYGPRGGRGLARRAAWATFDNVLRNFGALAGVGDLAFKVLPLPTKLKLGLPAMARVFTQISDQHSTVEDNQGFYLYTIHRCPVCWGRRSDKPLCYAAVGLLEESLRWVSGHREFRVVETRCIALGDPVCEFRVEKEPIG